MLPLDGFRILDLTRFLSGPYCTMVLAEFGADVVKVEQPVSGDDSRRLAPKVNGESYPFAMPNRSKRSVSLDLKANRGRDAFLRLAAEADLVIENFRPGVVKRLGIDYETLKRGNEDLIYCSISGFGQTGPYRDRPGFDIMAQGTAGFLRMTGHPDGRPTKVGIAINDIAAGVTAVYSIFAAELVRAKTGRGQHLDISLVDAGLAWTVWESGAYFGGGETPEPTGTRHRRSTPYQAYRTINGYVTIGANNDRLWERFVTRVVDKPEWLTDERFATLPDRMAHIDQLEAEIEAITATKTTDEWVEILDKAGVPGGHVLTYEEALRDPHIQSRGMIVDLDHPIIGAMKTIAPPTRFSGLDVKVRGPAPWLGQHTTEVLGEAGFSNDEIDALYADGIAFDAHPELHPASVGKIGTNDRAHLTSPRIGARLMSDDLVVERDGAVATVVLNRPNSHNAITLEMYKAIPALFATLDADESVKVVVIRGAGTTAFASGADISEFEEVRGNAKDAKSYNQCVAAAEHAIENVTKPTIALIHGYCIGGGCGLALSADLRFGDDRTRMAITPAKLGLVYSLESTKRLVDLVGPARTKWILMSGQQIGAEQAHRLGLLDDVAPVEDLDELTYDFAKLLTTRAQFSVRAAKQIVSRILSGQVEDDEDTIKLRNTSFDTEDYAEGVRAFLEKRTPRFR